MKDVNAKVVLILVSYDFNEFSINNGAILFLLEIFEILDEGHFCSVL